MKAVNILFPHQLFQQHALFENDSPIYLVEEHLFFKEFKFHKVKLAFHRATMKSHAALMANKGLQVHYIESTDARSDVRKLIAQLAKDGVEMIHAIDPTDDWLEQRVQKSVVKHGLELTWHENPLFINSREDLGSFFKPTKKSFFQTSFYKQQRVKREILLEPGDQPVGGQWSFDGENRKKYPKGKTPPAVHFPEADEYWKEALTYVEEHFPDHPGMLSETPYYPTNRAETDRWLNQFFELRFHEFGDYEDAIVREHTILNHSVLTPMLNVGLIAPMEVVEQAISYAQKHNVPINSLEGFVRQIIGWREFIRGMYECKGGASRTMNYWGFQRKIPASFYDGTTGIDPVDQVIKRVLKTGYCHHIERLMVLGNVMLLCEFDPDEVYRWFMELFIDAYDWVMVPNVYGMSQFADGGFFATKPYISGSNYIRKMSNFPTGDWQPIWDGLFWRFIDQHQDFFRKNPRLSMMVHSFNKMSAETREKHLTNAERYLAKMDQEQAVSA